MEIRAALAHDTTGPLVVEAVVLDDPRPDEIRVALTAAGICHTDVAVKAAWNTMGGPELFPAVFGHEGSGVVEAVGSEVRAVKVGDHVVISYASCTTCTQCGSGRPYYCEHFRTHNAIGTRPDGSITMSRNGSPVYGNFFGQSSFATHAITTEANTVVVDPDLDLVTAAPLGCGIQTGAGTVLNTMRLGPGATIAVFGAGAVGLSAVMAAKAVGANIIVVVDPLADRLTVASELGATHVVDPTRTDPVAAIRDATGGGGVVGSFETSARVDVLKQALESLAPMGLCVAVGVGYQPFEFDPTLVRGGRRLTITVEGEAAPQRFIPELLELRAAGKLPLEKIITTYAFDDIAAAFDDAQRGVTIKPVVVF